MLTAAYILELFSVTVGRGRGGTYSR
jgi:hypothetical protein